MAVSLLRGEDRDPEAAADWTARFAAAVIESGEPVFLNINIPAWPGAGLDAAATRLTDLALLIEDRNARPLTVEVGPRAGTAEFGLRMDGEDAGPGSEAMLVGMGTIAVTPLQLEMTDTSRMSTVQALLDAMPGGSAPAGPMEQ